MKYISILLICFCTVALSCSFAQNQVPSISELTATVDHQQKVVNIHYNVEDQESDPLEVNLKISLDDGKTFFISAQNVSGHIGFPVTPGTDKMIVWEYPDSITDFSEYMVLLEATDRKSVDIQELADQVDSLQLYSNVEFMQGIRHLTAGALLLQTTRDSVYNRFARYGLLPWIHHFEDSGLPGQNITGKIPGILDEEITIILDAHYDGVSHSPGADDNASGVAGMLECARILAKYNFDRSIRFIAFDLEEEGLIGSDKYVESGGILPGENIFGVLNFEMIGYKNERPNSQSVPAGFNVLFPDAYAELQADNFRGNFIASIANSNSRSLNDSFRTNAQKFVPQLKVIDLVLPGDGSIAPDFRRSDHASFWDAGYKAIMITDGGNFRNPNYHSATDVIDSLDFTFMTNVVKATVATAAALAGPRHSDAKVAAIQDPLGRRGDEWNCELFAEAQRGRNSMRLSFNKKCLPGMLKVEMVDHAGRFVLKQENLKGAPVMQVSLNNPLSSGIYILKVQNEDGRILSKKIWVP
ncbi:MAG: M20/M25/M40 family metallo-hydrolase [Bacteroidia bacterium]